MLTDQTLLVAVKGGSDREIASVLHLSEDTVENHVSAVLTTLGVRDRTRAVLRGLELRLLDR